ncbi:hypothetical protein Acor_18280 [Acrocarpospora corrugata]|uniref:WH2 domain-containing protein n=1 Tax=Acrocarpospora corrugata TaxID=35763 RepID=A0A5M3VSP1_9ACTN|nr:DUF4132 domain-containing protein [Acrocarpospora corrugata]GER99764.1 hypothetical protein Acor_18280 [Acrocarpospora corrugata]
MGVVDELPAEHRAWLNGLDQASLDVFAQLDAVYEYRYVSPQPTLADTPMGKLAQDWGDAEWRAMGVWAQLRMHILWQRQNGPGYCWILMTVPTAVARRKLGWTPAEIDLLWRTAAVPPGNAQQREELFKVPVAVLKRLSTAEREPYLEHLRRADTYLNEHEWTAKWSARRFLDDVLSEHSGGDAAASAKALLTTHDEFAVLLAEEYAVRLGAADVLPLLRHWTTATSARPSAKWLKQAAALGTPDAVAVAREVLGRIPAHREKVERRRHDDYEWTVITYLHERTAMILRGMVWTCEPIDEPWVTPLLGDVAVATGTGIGGAGANARSELLANAAIGVLARRGGLEVVSQLARVQAKVRKKTILAGVTRTLDAVAVQTGLSPEQLLERTVPTFGLGPDGTRTEHGLRLGIDGVVDFVDPAGKIRKTIPKAVREEHAELLAEIKATAKELKKALPAERFRIERALATERQWRWHEVCEFYLDHPITGQYGRSLIWEVLQGPSGLPVQVDGVWELTDPAGHRIQPRPETPVHIWHPISHTMDEVRTWRDHLIETGLRQPFKQAFREVYLLTPAEEETRDHSRRFTGHLLRYGQAKALLTERGWTGMSLGHWGWEYGSDQADATKALPGGRTAHWDFHLDEGSAERDNVGTVSICVSGHLRFTDDRGATIPLAQLDPLALSEALRDADLAVGVASTGLDPEGTGEYWQSYGFGDLPETAQIRRDALTRLLPRLAIADRCTLTDRFLHVRGDLRTYKIHLGSGNILMEPNDAYLCIVSRGSGDQLFLPFEENGGMLSIILSKAFLLAADTAITDPSITRQLT